MTFNMAKILFIFQLSVLLFVSLVVLVKRLIKIPLVQNVGQDSIPMSLIDYRALTLSHYIKEEYCYALLNWIPV